MSKMERQAAYDLLKCFLENRKMLDIDCPKELPGLLAYGVAKGCFINPDTVFEQAEWRKFGDKSFEDVINEQKAAKKLMKPWRAVINALAIHKAEQKVAAAAAERLGGTNSQKELEISQYPLPPSVRTFTITQQGGSVPSAPPPPPEAPEAEGLEKKTSMNPFVDDVQGRGREGLWAKIAEEAMQEGNYETAAQLTPAFPVVYSPPDAQGNVTVNMTNLDWKLLTQLRSTVSDFGIKGEPTRQMLDYIWGTNILLPGDIRSIMKLILTQHQQLLFNAHWHSVCQESVAVVRQPGDPLHGVTLEELMGLGPYFRLEAQALLGPDKAKESMGLARRALDQIKEPGGIPSYMGIKQGREEPFGLFIDRVANAIQAAGVPDYLKGTILKQCALQNCNPSTRNILATLPSTWTIEEGLERMAQVPVGPQAMLIEAIKQVGESISKGLKQNQEQVFAALAPLQKPMGPHASGRQALRCYRCGIVGHMKRRCKTANVWCPSCRSNTHNESACRKGGQGNGKASGKSRPATTQKAAFPTTAATTAAPIGATNPFVSSQPQAGAWDWTWQRQ